MIRIKLQGHDYRYELEEIIRLFYPAEELEYTDAGPSAGFTGVFVTSSLQVQGDEYRAVCHLCEGERPAVENAYAFQGISPAGDESSEHPLRKQLKREVKRCLYLVLSRYTGKSLPWGILTGIRPAKIVHEMLEQGLADPNILKVLTEYYLLQPGKAELLLEVARSEQNILARGAGEKVSLYIGIPFCATRCLYCSFTSYPVERYGSLTGEYLDALEKEMKAVAFMMEEHGVSLQSVYIGGGTPTALNSRELERLLGLLQANFHLEEVEEYTVEAGRPDTLDREKLSVIRDSRVDRISINPQTMNAKTLEIIGRRHSPEDILRTFALARSLGFQHINMDIIAGLPEEDVADFSHTLTEIGKLRPESLTVHTMSVKRASRLNEERDRHVLTSGEEVARMVDMAGETARAMGLHPYYLYRQKNILGHLENIGYCRQGFESIYNVQIMEEKQTILALGAGAITKVVYPGENRIERAFNVKSLEEYIARVDEMIARKKQVWSGN